MRTTRPHLALIAGAVLCAAIAANLWALRVPLRVDFTRHGVFSLGPETERALAALDEPLRITFFYDLRNQSHRDALALLRRYEGASPWVRVRAHDPDLEPGIARAMGVRFAGEAVFEAAGPPVRVRGGDEQTFTNGLLRASRGAGRVVCFSAGHGESDPESHASHDHFETAEAPGHDHSGAGHTGGEPLRVVERHGMGVAREALETLGYRVETRVLAAGPDALRGCAALVVASPRSAFAEDEVATLRRFLDGGGHALLLLEPGLDSGLGALLAEYGVAPVEGLVRDPERHYWTDPGTPAVSRYPRHRITRDLGLSFFPGAGAFTPAPGGVPHDVVATPLLETSDAAHLTERPETEGVHTLGLYAVRTRDRGGPEERATRLAVVGDGDFATNSFFSVLGNRDLFLNTVHVLADSEALVGIAPRGYGETRFDLTGAQLRTTFAVSALLLPGAALLGALLAWRRRSA